MHEAARQGSEDVVTVLMARGSSLSAKDRDGNTAIHVAARWGHLAIVEMLIEHNADVEILNNCGQTYSDLVSTLLFFTFFEFLTA